MLTAEYNEIKCKATPQRPSFMIEFHVVYPFPDVSCRSSLSLSFGRIFHATSHPLLHHFFCLTKPLNEIKWRTETNGQTITEKKIDEMTN